MIRLELSLAECAWLWDWLQQSQTEAPDEAMRQQVAHKVAAAQELALLVQLCPICQQTFTQLHAGRQGRYCSNACRQKAYRQRQREWRTHSRTRRPD